MHIFVAKSVTFSLLLRSSLSFAFCHVTPRLYFELDWYKLTNVFAVPWPYNFLAAYGTLGSSLSRVWTLLLPCYESFHDARVTEEVTYIVQQHISISSNHGLLRI